jgi:serine/threonine protein kinase
MRKLTINTKLADPSIDSAHGSPDSAQQKPTPRRSSTMGFSSKDLVAAELARDRNRPLHVPPMFSPRPGSATLDALTTYARKMAPGVLLDEEGNYFAMSKVIAHGTFGNIRLGLKYDEVISQVWIFKEIASDTPSRAQSFTNLPAAPTQRSSLLVPNSAKQMGFQTATPLIAEGPEESLAAEVNLMHKAQSPLAPHAVLRTVDRAYMMLPLADTDLHKVWAGMYEWPIAQRQPIVLAVARQLIKDLCTLHESGSAHRDLKPSNIFLTREGATFLGDYGMAVPLGEVATNVGTYHYLAPEVLWNPNHDKQKSDIFSVGAVLTSLVTNTGFLWKDLWNKPELIADLRSSDTDPKNLKTFVKIVDSYKYAYDLKPNKNTLINLKKMPMAKGIYEQFRLLKTEFPALSNILKAMQHYDPAKRPSPQEVMAYLSSSKFSSEESDLAQLRDLVGTSERPMRAAADEQALVLEAKVRDFMQTQKNQRRNSLGSVRRYTTPF